MSKKELSQLLCKSRLPNGDYDDLIKDHMKKIIFAIMTKSRGRENPKMVIERIRKIAGEYGEKEKSFEFQGTIKEFHELTKEEPIAYDTHELYGADPNCDHEVVHAPGGGVKCKHCPGWFCF
jgi:hypothetical protein